MNLRNVFLQLYISLMRIAEHHREVDDPRVRAQLAETIHYYFTCGNPRRRLPVTYGMATPEGDWEVVQAMGIFLQLSDIHLNLENLVTREDRQRFLETPHIQTLVGAICGQSRIEDVPLQDISIAEHRFHPPVYEFLDNRKPRGGWLRKTWRKRRRIGG